MPEWSEAKDGQPVTYFQSRPSWTELCRRRGHLLSIAAKADVGTAKVTGVAEARPQVAAISILTSVGALILQFTLTPDQIVHVEIISSLPLHSPEKRLTPDSCLCQLHSQL